MTRTIQDLWPEDITASVPWPPVALLREQAGLLGPRTRGLVEAEVNTVTSGDNIIHHFELVAPALGGYRYRLFTVGHEVGLYPLWIEWEREELKADDEHALREHLATILSSDRTKRVVRALLAQSTEVMPPRVPPGGPILAMP